jgi:hypothetical protein
VYGFDVYVVRQDETAPESPTMKYRVGVQEDCAVVVDIGDMGLIDDVGDKDDLVIPVHRMREALEEEGSGVAFVPAEAARNEMRYKKMSSSSEPPSSKGPCPAPVSCHESWHGHGFVNAGQLDIL